MCTVEPVDLRCRLPAGAVPAGTTVAVGSRVARPRAVFARRAYLAVGQVGVLSAAHEGARGAEGGRAAALGAVGARRAEVASRTV